MFSCIHFLDSVMSIHLIVLIAVGQESQDQNANPKVVVLIITYVTHIGVFTASVTFMFYSVVCIMHFLMYFDF